MRILFLLTQDLNSPSGIGRYLPMAVNLAKLGHQIQIATTHSNYRSLQEKNQLINQVEIRYVAQMHVTKSGSLKTYFNTPKLIWNTLVSTIRLTQAALSKPVDLIYVGKPHPMNSVAGLAGRLRWGCPLVVDLDDDEVATGNFKNPWQKSVVKWFFMQIPKWANWVTTNTHYLADKLAQRGLKPGNIVYIPNGIDLNQFANIDITKINILKRELNLENHEIVIYVGTLSRTSHPVDLLIEAFKLVRCEIPSAILLLVGGGEDFGTLKEQVKIEGLEEVIHFFGKVSPESVNTYYHLANVSVDPVYDDEVARSRCPLKLFESWACEIPFATGDVGDRRYLAGEPTAALLTKPGDSQDLAKAIIKILKNPEIARSLVTNANKRLDQFRWEVLALELNQEIIKRRGK